MTKIIDGCEVSDSTTCPAESTDYAACIHVYYIMLVTSSSSADLSAIQVDAQQGGSLREFGS